MAKILPQDRLKFNVTGIRNLPSLAAKYINNQGRIDRLVAGSMSQLTRIYPCTVSMKGIHCQLKPDTNS